MVVKTNADIASMHNDLTQGASNYLITALDREARAWGNAQCPCLHSDPKFPDCPPDQTVRVRGWLSFYEGTDIHAEFRRIDLTGWRQR